jgi:hypothetical protein
MGRTGSLPVHLTSVYEIPVCRLVKKTYYKNEVSETVKRNIGGYNYSFKG